MLADKPIISADEKSISSPQDVTRSHSACGYDVCPMCSAEIRKQRADCLRAWPQWQWHLDEMFVKINGENHYLWWAVDHEGEVLEAFVTKPRNR